MADTLRASEQGLELINQARRKKGWTKNVTLEWWQSAKTSQATLKRFWQKKPIERATFIEICQAVGVTDWGKVADYNLPELEAPNFNPSSLPEFNPNFIGREKAIAKLNSLFQQGAKVVLILGEGGIGKTALAWHYLSQFELFIDYRMAKETKDITPVEALVEDCLKRYFDEEPARDFGMMLKQLQCHLIKSTRRIGIRIDNLEPALSNGHFIDEHYRYIELLNLLTDPSVQSITLLTSREPLYEPRIQSYWLEELTIEAWQQYFYFRRINTGNLSFNDETSALYQLHHSYGGNAEFMCILSSSIQNESDADLEVYWQKNCNDLLFEHTLEKFVKRQLDKLASDSPQAYNLLCRVGCYRYQDVPFIPEAGFFALLWDVPEERNKRRLIKTLRDCSLIKSCNNEYYLHPVIRAEAIARLRASEDQETANRAAANFWTDIAQCIETRREALTALEAYYHYTEIRDFFGAASVIARCRNSELGFKEPLGCAFYRLGLLQTMLFAINEIIDHLEPSYNLSRLYNILGDLNWMIGFPSSSMKAHIRCELLARQVLETTDFSDEITVNLKRLECVSLFNRSLVYFDLWQIKEAIDLVEACRYHAVQNNFTDYEYSCYYYLAFLYSLTERKLEALLLARWGEHNLEKINDSAWSRGYCLVFLGSTYILLGDYKKSFEKLECAIVFSKKCHYIQLQAKALVKIAEVHRICNDFEKALFCHMEAIQLLEKLSTKCDLAEAYYQLGFTYQKMDELEKSLKYGNRAIQLFSKMDAPRQVERVRRTFNFDV